MGGFKEARYELPGYKELWNEGFTPSETARNIRILRNNEEFIIECSTREGGGICLTFLLLVDLRFIFGQMKVMSRFTFMSKK